MARRWHSIFRRKSRKGVVLQYTDASGRTRQRQCPTRAAAEEMALRLKSLVDPGKDATLEVYAARWLARVGEHLRAGTQRQYRTVISRHVLPGLGRKRLRDLDRGCVKDLLVAKLGQGLSRKTVANIKGALQACLEEARDDGYLVINPAQFKARLESPQGATNVKALDAGQLRAFLWAAILHGEPWSTLFRLMALTGLRLGEALALRWEDIEGRELWVRRSVFRGRVERTKTGIERSVDLASDLTEVLRSWNALQAENWLRTGALRPPWIFPAEHGGPIYHDTAGRAMKAILKAARLPDHHTPHSLRHTFASLHLQAGESIYYVQRQLGHANISMTVDTYGHWLPAGNAAAADRLEMRLR
jgi:integrase